MTDTIHVTGPKAMPGIRGYCQMLMPYVRRDDREQMASMNDIDPLDIRNGPDWEMYYATPEFAPLFHELARTWDPNDWYETLNDVIRQLGIRQQGALFMGFDIRNRPWLNLEYSEWMRTKPHFFVQAEDNAVIDLEHDALAVQANAVALGWTLGPDGKLRVAATLFLNNGVIRTGVAISQSVKVAVLLAWIMVNPEPNLVTVVEQRADEGLPPRVKKGMSRAERESLVHVVNLRQQTYRTIGEVREARRGLQHRFIVRGHWRKQPFGPGRQERKMIYIAPFMKGPVDAPFVQREKVYRW